MLNYILLYHKMFFQKYKSNVSERICGEYCEREIIGGFPSHWDLKLINFVYFLC